MAGNFQVGGWTSGSIAPRSGGVTRSALVPAVTASASPAAAATAPASDSSAALRAVLAYNVLAAGMGGQSSAPAQQGQAQASYTDQGTGALQVQKAQSVHDWGTMGAVGANSFPTGTGVSQLMDLTSRLSRLGGYSYDPATGVNYVGKGGWDVGGMQSPYGQDLSNRANILNAALFGTGVQNQFSAPAMIGQAAAGSNAPGQSGPQAQQRQSGWVSGYQWQQPQWGSAATQWGGPVNY